MYIHRPRPRLLFAIASFPPRPFVPFSLQVRRAPSYLSRIYFSCVSTDRAILSRIPDPKERAAHGDSASAVFQSGTVKSSALALAVAVERTEPTIVERVVATYGIARCASQSLRTMSAASIAALRDNI